MHLEANFLFIIFAAEISYLWLFIVMEKRRVIQKRYQYRSKKGIEWTEWFDYNGQQDPIQLKGSKGNDLRNEYRTIEK